MNEITDNEKYINDKIIWNYFKYQNPSLLAKDLIRATEAKNWKFVSYDNGRLVNLRNALNKKQIPENQNPKKQSILLITSSTLLNFNKRQVDLLQVLQRLPIALTQVKASNTSKSLLNKIRKIVYSLYRAKELVKKYATI